MAALLVRERDHSIDQRFRRVRLAPLPKPKINPGEINVDLRLARIIDVL
jgi:hypothetical protein